MKITIRTRGAGTGAPHCWRGGSDERNIYWNARKLSEVWS